MVAVAVEDDLEGGEGGPVVAAVPVWASNGLVLSPQSRDEPVSGVGGAEPYDAVLDRTDLDEGVDIEEEV